MSGNSISAVLATAGFLVLAQSAAARGDCQATAQAFDRAFEARSATDLFSAYGSIVRDTECGFKIDKYRPRALEAMIAAAADPRQAGEREAALRFVLDNMAIAGNWRLAEQLADYYAQRGGRADALKWYEKAIDFVSSRPATHASASDRLTLLKRAAAAKIVVNDDGEGRSAGPYIPSQRELGGAIGGVFSRDLIIRGAEPVAVPLPINFVYAQTTFTPAGNAAAAELAEAILQQNVPSLRLIGHADPRGDRQANRVLSLRRAEAVKAFLVSKGVTAAIATEGVGADEAFDTSVLAYQPTQEEIWALDRRVEFLR